MGQIHISGICRSEAQWVQLICLLRNQSYQPSFLTKGSRENPASVFTLVSRIYPYLIVKLGSLFPAGYCPRGSFLASRGYLHSLASGSLPPSSKTAMAQIVLTLEISLASSSASSVLLLQLVEILHYWWLYLDWVYPDNPGLSSHLNDLNLKHIAKIPLPYKVVCS